MGKKNTITKDYMSVPEHFADCFNHYLYAGMQVIKPEQLKPWESTELTIIPKEDRDALAKLQEDESFRSVDADAVRLLNVCTNSNIKVTEGEPKVDMCGGLKALLEEKESEGLEKGRGLLLKTQVGKKVEKGYSVEEIAEMLEEDVKVIQVIVKELKQE